MSTTKKSILFLAIAYAVTWAIVIGSWSAGLHLHAQLAIVVLAGSMIGPTVAALICAIAFEKGKRVGLLLDVKCIRYTDEAVGSRFPRSGAEPRLALPSSQMVLE